MLRQLCKEFEFFCVGSLPFERAIDALDWLIAHPNILPFWPELPNSSSREFMIPRSGRAFDISWNSYAQDEASGLFELKSRLLHSAKPKLLKCQVVGPLTQMLYGPGEGDTGLLDKCIEVAAKEIACQKKILSELAIPLLFVLDEPGMVGWTKITPGEKNKIIEAYTTLAKSCAGAGDFLGLHSCGTFIPDILSWPFDLFSFEVTAERFDQIFSLVNKTAWSRAVSRAVFAPGLFPAVFEGNRIEAQERIAQAEGLYNRILDYFGADSDVLLVRSAACGHAGASLEWIDQVYQTRI